MRYDRTKRTPLALAAACAATMGAAPGALAQAPGDVLWTFDGVAEDDFVRVHPGVADDGTIYFPAGDLFALNPDGTLQWSFPLTPIIPEAVSFDAERVYAGAEGTIFALDRDDGSQMWSFTDDTFGVLQAGPSVGPDGNVYAIYESGDVGAISLTPDGQTRWTLGGFSHNGGSGHGEIPFASDRFFHADQHTPAEGFFPALLAIDFDGDILWSVDQSGSPPPRPRAAPNEHVHQQGTAAVSAREPDGDLLWSRDAGQMNRGPGIGPDSAVYVNEPFENNIVAYEPDGDTRWVAEDLYPLDVAGLTRPTVSPDNEVLVFGTTTGNGGDPLGRIVALDVQTGDTLWSITLESSDLHVRAAPAFSPDGQVVYVPVENEAGPSELRAIQAQPVSCPADFNGDGQLDVLDFLAFQDAFDAGDPAADCNADDAFDVLDFICFQNLFQAGCP